MLKSQIPTKFVEAFGVNATAGLIRTIPVASQIGITPGAASLNDGFVPLNATALASGGIPPAIQDFNGILNQATAWDMWTAAAGIAPYDATFQTAIGGYPAGAVVYTGATTVPGRVWVSTADNNTTNPDTGGAGWLSLQLASDVITLLGTRNIVSSSATVYATPGTYTFTVPTGATVLRARVWGAGGGGGGSFNANSCASGGCGGGYADGIIIGVFGGQSITVVVGAGGTAGIAGGGNGAAGGSSSVAATIASTGGAGGLGSSSGTSGTPAFAAAGSPPGAGSGGTINLSGGGSGTGFLAGSTSLLAQGAGGWSPNGVAATQVSVNAGGLAGTAPGGGGGGSSANAAGGAGAPGRVEIYTN
jgi:hypothetical protein